MKSLKNLAVIFFGILALVVFKEGAFAQCAMCKATAASDLKNAGAIGKGLNFGILYLMTIPYIILGSLVFLFFRKQITQKFQIIKSKMRI